MLFKSDSLPPAAPLRCSKLAMVSQLVNLDRGIAAFHCPHSCVAV
jgi:hypothetical protein